MKSVSKYKSKTVGTGKIWKDADTAKTVEQSLGSVLKNKPPNSHITQDTTDRNPIYKSSDSF